MTDDNDGTADNTIRVIIRLTDDTTDNAKVVNSAPYFNFAMRETGSAPLAQWMRTQRRVMNIGDVLGATDDDAGDDLTFAFDPVLNANFDIDTVPAS